MDTTSGNAQGYSDFFTSGLRAMAGHGRRRTKAKSVDLTQNPQNRSSFWTDEYFELGHSNNPFSRRRHLSVIIGGSSTSSTMKDVVGPTSPTKKRRSGFSSFSARFFSRLSSTQFKEPISSPSILPATHDEDDDLFADDEKEQSSISIESTSLPSLHRRSSSPSLQAINTFSPRSDGSIVFDPSPDLPTFKIEKRRESFLSMNSSSSNISSMIFPAVPWDHPTLAGTRSPFTPSPYAQSSSSSSASSWNADEEEEGEREVDEEEEISMEASYTESEDRETCDWDAPARLDWRQFHVHLIQIAK